MHSAEMPMMISTRPLTTLREYWLQPAAAHPRRRDHEFEKRLAAEAAPKPEEAQWNWTSLGNVLVELPRPAGRFCRWSRSRKPFGHLIYFDCYFFWTTTWKPCCGAFLTSQSDALGF